jgi:hypothetical protein
MFARGCRRETDAPAEPVRGGAEAARPKGLTAVELGDEDEEARGGGAELCGEGGELVLERAGGALGERFGIIDGELRHGHPPSTPSA